MRIALHSSVALMLALPGCGDAGLQPEPGEHLSGGDATVADDSQNAFSRPIPGLDRDQERGFFRGRALFRDDWVTAPSSTQSRDGLGPVFNARSCEACHVRDGRGRPPIGDEPMGSMLIRLSVPGGEPGGAPAPEPSYGGQLQPLAITPVTPEGAAHVRYEDIVGHYDDGQEYRLQRPIYSFTDLGYGPMHPDVLLSPRVAPAMIGLGLLEAVPEADVRSLADPDDVDGDGISGRVNEVWDVQAGALALGRFGLKANQPSIRQQVAGAFVGDIGITSSLFPQQSCTAAQSECAAATSGGDPELLDAILDDVTLYALTLAVPARRRWDDPEVLRGKELFMEAGCAACHTPALTTGASDDLPQLAGQVIRPFTDLLLHDMGEGLADDRPDFAATGREWRTPPLWGIGLVDTVNGHTALLHDGRARGFAEAILWHGGEAEASQQQFRAMSRPDRDALVRFLESL